MKLIAIGAVILISYIVLIAQFYMASRKGFNSTTDVVMKEGRLAVLNERHLVSLLAMAAAVLYVGFVNSDWLLLAMPNAKALALTVVAAVAACAISITTARKVVRNDVPDSTTIGSPEQYLCIRALFLMVYELFFRAVLLNFCIALVGVPVAIAINVVLYAIAHAFSTRQELIGTVPFGILLCLITLFSGSVWPAVVIHLLLGLPYDVLIVNPKRNTKTYLL
jgi:membrane protease YdiL (CAAX protease family)